MRTLKPPAVWALPVLAGAVMLAAVWALRFPGGSSDPARPPLEFALPPPGAQPRETHVPRRPLLLRLDLAGLPPFPVYWVELDDVLGVRVLQDGLGATDAKVAFKVPKLPPGRYFIRVTAPSGELLREYAIGVR